MTFIALETDLEEDPRLHVLTSIRKWSRDYAVAFMFRFWRAVRRGAAADGDVTTWTDEFIASQTETKGKCVGLVEDLLKAGLLFKDGDRLIVEGWEELNGMHIRKNLTKEDRSAGGRKRASTGTRNERGQFLGPGVVPGVTPGNGPGVPPGPAGPAASPANPAEPEPQPEPEPKEVKTCPEPAASGPPHTVFGTVGKPKTFSIHGADVAEWERAYPGVSVADELRKMAAWLKANPTRRKTASGMPRFIYAWLSRAQNSTKGAPAAETLAPEERRRREKEGAAKRARELEESRRRDVTEADPATTEKFVKALKLHQGEPVEAGAEGGAS